MKIKLNQLIFVSALIGIFFIPLSVRGAAARAVAAQAPEVTAKKLKPTEDACRPGIRLTADGNPHWDDSTLTADLEGGLSCMLAGFKNIYFDSSGEESKFDEFISKNKLLLDANKISYNKISVSSPDSSMTLHYGIMYTPAGKKDAVLLIKYLQEQGPGSNGYAEGHLLGYSDADIKAYYLQKKVWDQESFDSWLKENASNIKKWLEEI